MLTDQTTQSETIIACTPDGVPANQRERSMEVGKQVYAAVQEVQELPDDYWVLSLKIFAQRQLCVVYVHDGRRYV